MAAAVEQFSQLRVVSGDYMGARGATRPPWRNRTCCVEADIVGAVGDQRRGIDEQPATPLTRTAQSTPCQMYFDSQFD
jgi:hypothetical protein